VAPTAAPASYAPRLVHASARLRPTSPMPILPAESDSYPPDLWSESMRFDPAARWWCLHTKPRQEKAAARDLGRQQICHYLPQAVRTSRTPSGRATRSVIPLFPGYLFLHGREQDRLAALRGNRLVGTLWVEDQAELTRDLTQVHRMLGSGLPIIPEPTYSVGALVRVTQGPLTGLIGLVTRRGKRDRFTAVVRFLGQGASVDLEDWQVEPFTEPRPCDRAGSRATGSERSRSTT
jgi:transcription antitermination factor NusG